ncbi:MAG TPA: hypothetical protein VEI97_05535, partial [bacterium]|nr:hypothetical protein [bacterium]
SKTTLAALVEAYEIYRALHRSRPAAASGVLPTQEIAFINCATSEEQAKVHYRTLMGYLARLDVTPVEGNIDRGLECLLPGGLRILSLHSNARSLRGRTAKVVVFDELAHFQQTGGPMSDEEVYRALAPSVRTFGDRGRILITSSPADPSGVLWDLYQARGTQPGLLVAQFATWEFNPHIRREDLEPEFRRHPAWAASEYGAQFPAQSAAAFLATAVVEAAVHHAPRRADCLDPAQCYFAHLDLGLLHDRTAVAVGHVEVLDGRRVAVVDLVQTWQASKGQSVSVGTVERWIRDLAGRVPLHGVSADPHESSLLLERLSAAGLHTKAIPYSGPRKLALYLRLEDWLLTGQLHLPRDPLLIAELTHLRRQTSASGAALFAAPRSGPVRTDDCADAVAGLLEWLAAPVAGLSHTVRTVDGAW